MTVPFAMDITRTRYAAGAYVDGAYVNGALTTATIRGSVQPAGYAQLMRLSEGDRTKGAVTVYSESELSPGSEATGMKPDEITWQGEQWAISQVDAWQSGHYAPSIGPMWRAIAVRVDR